MTDPSLKRQGAELFIGRASSFFIQILTPIILVRLLTKGEYGIYQQFLLAANVTANIIGLGLVGSLYYFYPIEELAKRRIFLFQTQCMLFIQGLLFVLLLFIYHEHLLKWVNLPGLEKNFPLLGIYVLFFVASSILNEIFTLEKRILFNRYFFPGERLIRCLLVVTFVLIIGGTVSCFAALVFYAFSRFLFVSAYLCSRYYRFKSSLVSMSLLKEQITYSLPIAGAFIIRTIGTQIDKFMVNAYISPEEYAVYSVAFISIPLLSQMYSSIINVTIPQVVVYAKQGKVIDIAKLWHKAVDKIASVSIPAVIFFWIMADEMIEFLFTRHYLPAANLYRVYISCFLFYMLAHGIVLRAYKKTNLILMANIFGTVITVSTGYFLIKHFGMFGAAITAFFGVSFPIIIQLLFEKKILALSFRNWLPWKDLAQNIFIVMLPGMALFSVKLLSVHIFFKLVIGGIIFFPAVVMLQYKTGIFIYPEVLKKISSLCKRYLTNYR